MNQEKNINSLISIIFIIVIIICGIIVLGVYMNDRWKNMRDIRRQADIKNTIKAVDIYYLDHSKLPDNVTNNEWDSSYDLANNNQTLFKVLRDNNLLSQIFDPKNNEEYQYRYHKFKRGEYGCSRTFAIFQVTKFETEVEDHGQGECLSRNFVLDAPNGYTYMWFE
jgi:hypothetical protein